MGIPWFLLVMAAAVFVSLVLLAVVCLRCRNKGPLLSISQGNVSEEYIPSSEFRIIHPSQPTMERNFNHPSSNQLLPFSPSTGSQQRQRSFTPTETESNQSYENPTNNPEYVNTDSDIEDPGYIIVLPKIDTPLTNQSRASTSSSDVQSDYVNVPSTTVSEDKGDYQNVESPHCQNFPPELRPELSAPTDSSDGDDDDDGEDANYVNVQTI